MSTFPKLIRGSKLVKICTGDNLDSSVLNNLGGNKKGFMYSAKLGLLGAGLVTLIGCAEFDEYLNQNQNDLLGAMAETTALTNPDLTDEQRASLGVMSRYAYREGDQKSEREVARQGRSSVNVYTGDQGSQKERQHLVKTENGTLKPSEGYVWVNPEDSEDLRVVEIKKIEPELITFNKWVDMDKDNNFDSEEVFGLGKKVFDLTKEEMAVGLCTKVYEGNVFFRTWTNSGELIGETKIYAPFNTVPYKLTGPNSNPNPPIDFMDKLKQAGPGKYRITATIDNGKTYITDVKIIGD